MKSTEYIEWDKLEQIPFCLCRIAEDEENQEIDVYYLDKRVCHDYDHVGHYFRTAIIMFGRIRNITADCILFYLSLKIFDMFLKHERLEW